MAEQRTSSFLALDLGAESGRAVLGTLDAGRLKLQEMHRFANTPGRMNGQLQWNLLGLWEDLKTGLRKAVAGAQKLSGIGVDTWGVDFGLISASGEILGNPTHYRDPRTDGVVERVFERVPRQQVFDATGVQIMQLNTLYQLYAMRQGGQGGSKLLEAAQTLLFMPDLFNYLFTGVRRCEYSIASTSQMYDPRKRDWARELLAKLDIPSHFLLPIVPSGSIVGPVQKSVMEECGVDAIPVIAPGGHDTASAVAAVPAEGDGWCYISSGTWSLMGVETPGPIINAKSAQYNFTNEGGVDGGIRFLKNIMGLWLVQECRRQWQREGQEHDYRQLTQMAADARPFVAVIDPDARPFLMPGQMPQKIAQFCRDTRQSEPQTTGEFVRTCLEALALAYRRTVERLEDILGKEIHTIHIVGGGTQNELLNQMAADACGRTVITGPVEATAIGNILVQAKAVGQVRDLAEARAIVRASFDVRRYEPRDAARWDAAYARFREVAGQ